MIKFIRSGNVDKAAAGLRDANAVPTFAPISKAHPGLLDTFFAILFDTFFIQTLEEVSQAFCCYSVISNNQRYFSNKNRTLSI